MCLRSPTPDELRLLRFLVSKAEGLSQDSLLGLWVAEMADGGMGSLRLYPEGTALAEGAFGRRASECQFADEDGVCVIASLNLDQEGHLFELDVWRTDFRKRIRIPENLGEPPREGLASGEPPDIGGLDLKSEI